MFNKNRTNVSAPWDNGYPSGGNYWSDYVRRNPYAIQIGNSGIGNKPYVSSTSPNVVDRYPLLALFNTSYVPETDIPKISLLSPLNQTYNESSVPLVFTVDTPVNWTGYSLDGKENVTITGNTTLSGLSGGLHNMAVYANDTYGNTAASETTIFTVDEPASFPTTEVAAATAAILGVAGGLVYFMKRRHNLA